MKYISLVDVTRITGIPVIRLINMIRNGFVNGVLITDGSKVVSGSVLKEDVDALKST